MSDPDGYRDGTALWTAAVARAKTTATQRGVEPASVLRGFVFDRFLARVFTRLDGPWVLKGGNAVLARVSDARATKDLDLLNELDDLDGAVAALRRLLDVDLAQADLRGAALLSCDLTRADLQGARLEGADLRGSRLDQVDSKDLDLRGVRIDITQAVQLAQQRGAVIE